VEYANKKTLDTPLYASVFTQLSL